VAKSMYAVFLRFQVLFFTVLQFHEKKSLLMWHCCIKICWSCWPQIATFVLFYRLFKPCMGSSHIRSYKLHELNDVPHSVLCDCMQLFLVMHGEQDGCLLLGPFFWSSATVLLCILCVLSGCIFCTVLSV
jgi:hypothetical protein